GSGTPAFVQNVQTEGSGTSFTSSSMTVSSGDLLVAEVSLLNFSSAPDVSSIKLDGSTAFTVGKDVAMGSQYRVFLAYLPSVSAGSHTVTVTANGTMSNAVLYVSEFSGVAASSPIDGSGASASGYGTTPASGTFTTTTNNDLWVSAYVGGTGGTTTTAESEWTLPANGSATGSGSSNPASAIEYQIAS